MTLPPEEGTPLNPAPPHPSAPPTPRPPTVEERGARATRTADSLPRERTSPGDVKLLSTAFKELRYSFKVFASLRGRRKVTVFGSARTRPDNPAYRSAVEFGRKIREAGFMVITG